MASDERSEICVFAIAKIVDFDSPFQGQARLLEAYCSSSDASNFLRAMAAEWDLPHLHMASSNGRSVSPSGVTL